MEKNSYFDTSAVASISIESLKKIKENIDTSIYLAEKRNSTVSSREKEVLLCGIEDNLLNIKDILGL